MNYVIVNSKIIMGPEREIKIKISLFAIFRVFDDRRISFHSDDQFRMKVRFSLIERATPHCYLNTHDFNNYSGN